MADNAIDWPLLKSRCLNDDAFVQEMLNIFRTHAGGLLTKLKAAVDASDVEAARKNAHTLKGSAANLAAEPLRAIAAAVEADARRNDLHAVRAAMPTIEKEFARCLAELDKMPA